MCNANDTLCADSSSCRVTAVIFNEDDRCSQVKVCATNEIGRTTNLSKNITEHRRSQQSRTNLNI